MLSLYSNGFNSNYLLIFTDSYHITNSLLSKLDDEIPANSFYEISRSTSCKKIPKIKNNFWTTSDIFSKK